MAGNDPYVAFLLHMNAAFLDFAVKNPKTWTAYGNAAIDTGIYKFGGGSGKFPASPGSWIDTPDSADFTIGSGDFAFDLWLRRMGLGDVRIVGQCNSTGSNSSIPWTLGIDSSNHLFGGICSGATGYWATSTGTITDTTTFHHVAIERYGNTVRLFIEGTVDGSVSVTGVSANDSANKMSLGRIGEYDGLYANVYVDEPRFSVGIARYQGNNFTPPIDEYTIQQALISVAGV